MLCSFRLSCVIIVWFKLLLVSVFLLHLARLSCIILTVIISVLISHLPECLCLCSWSGGLYSTHFSHLVLTLLINLLNSYCQSVSSSPSKILLFSIFCLLYVCSCPFVVQISLSIAGCSVAIYLFSIFK